MKRTFMLTVIAVALVLPAYFYGQKSRPGRVPPGTDSDERLEREQIDKAKAKEVLVKRLPDGVEGVELKNGAVRLRPGYKYVKQSDGTIGVALIAGGGAGGSNTGGSWTCECVGGRGACEEFFVADKYLGCRSTGGPNGCSGTCDLNVKRRVGTTTVSRF
jgi:hypothetical protein